MFNFFLSKLKFIRIYIVKYIFKDFATDYISVNSKNLYAYVASCRKKEVVENPLLLFPIKNTLISKPCTQNDLESGWSRFWINELKRDFVYHRKNWEFSFILQVLYNYDLLQSGRSGLGFGCGKEPLPSYFISKGCTITAGDKPLNLKDKAQKNWSKSRQYTQTIDSLYHPDIISRDDFEKNITLKYIDMNDLPIDLDQKFDFCWSVCAVEHLGSIRNGLKFLENSLRLLKKGGISVHTLEFNVFSDKETIDNWPDVLFRKKDMLLLSETISAIGGRVIGFDFDFGSNFFDNYIDVPPFPHQKISYSKIEPGVTNNPHLKLLINNFPSTCFGVIIEKTK
ncbi:MAG: methyltransferase domain-containing protein [Negativicutes bacterium]|nr:methyltransferase domain-containing protein [Negativicutes bacterium]